MCGRPTSGQDENADSSEDGDRGLNDDPMQEGLDEDDGHRSGGRPMVRAGTTTFKCYSEPVSEANAFDLHRLKAQCDGTGLPARARPGCCGAWINHSLPGERCIED